MDAPSQQAPAATAGAIAPAHNGTADSNVAPAIPKLNQIVPQSVPTNACWNGSQVQVDIIVDRSIGKALKYFVEFDVQWQNTDVSGNAYLPSSAALIDHYDILYNGSVIETVYANNLFYEGMVMKSDQELAQHAPIWGIDFDASGNPIPHKQFVGQGSGQAPFKTETQTYYCPLVGVVPSAQLFVAGVKGEIRYRLYLASKPLCGANGFVTPASISLNLQNMTLWVEEASLSDETFNALLQQHKSGINYRSVLRTLWQKTQPSLTHGNVQTDILNAFSNDSAGLLVYLTNNSLDTGYFMSRIPLTSMQLLDAGGATLTRVLGGSLVENHVTPGVTPVASAFVNNDTFSTYIFPFCSSIERVLNCGATPKGGLKLSAQEQLSINVLSTQSSAVLENVISFDYCAMRVQRGELKWARTAGDLPGWSRADY
jgi:hypothetical protein